MGMPVCEQVGGASFTHLLTCVNRRVTGNTNTYVYLADAPCTFSSVYFGLVLVY